MVVNIRKRLESLRSINLREKKSVNRGLFKLFCTEEFFTLVEEDYDFVAMGREQGERLEVIKELLKELQDQNFEFGVDNISRKNLPKKHIKDMLVHNGILCIIQCVYQYIFPKFSKNTYDKYESYQATLKEIKENWSDVNWGIGVNIKTSFMGIDPYVLISILRIKIQDECFIQLIWKLLSHERKLGHDKLNEHERSVLFKALNHIYLNEVDVFMENLIHQYNSSYFLVKFLPCTNQEKKVYRSFVIKNKSSLKFKKILDKRKGFSQYNKFQNFNKRLCIFPIKIRFIRYLDRVLIGVRGSKLFAQIIFYKIEQYLLRRLKLPILSDKTQIQSLLLGKLSFLGYEFRVSNFLNPQIQLIVPMDKVIGKLVAEGFSTSLGFGIRKKGWIRYPDKLIIAKYTLVNRRLRKCLLLASNYTYSMKRVQYILKYSCAHTLAAKHRTNLSIQISHLNSIGIFS